MILDEKGSNLYIIGDFAKKAGVTLRTLRYYDKIGLLKPSACNSAGHRLYSTQDFAKLQKILTLKFIGLSLEEIANIMKYDINDKDFKKSLEIQREIIDEKIQHMFMVRKAIEEAIHIEDSDSTVNWDKFINIINIINLDKSWLEQYENASNLRARIRIHELYSTNKTGWMEWFFKQLDIPDTSSILELGCGDASLWSKNFDNIPNGWNITLTDFSLGMLKDAKKNLDDKAKRFNFKIVDAHSIPFEAESFDVVIANHMLYHLSDIDTALSEIYRVLKPGGYFFASTVGKNHMAEMRSIASEFDSDALTSTGWKSLTQKFQLENGMEQLNKYFNDVKLKRYDDNLIVTKPEPIIDYILSMPGNTKEMLDDENLNRLIKFINGKIKKEGNVFITKDTGYFLGRK